jgi:hypothetical protein
MDKKLMIKICFVAAMVMACGTAYGGATTIAGVMSLGGGSFSPSNNVVIHANSTGTAYAAFAGHTQGDKVYFSNNTDPRLYYGTKAKGTAITDTSAADATPPSGWSSM